MPENCKAIGCSNVATEETKAKGISFHSFPKNPDMRKKWALALHRDNYEPKYNHVVCSEHFHPDDFKGRFLISKMTSPVYICRQAPLYILIIDLFYCSLFYFIVF